MPSEADKGNRTGTSGIELGIELDVGQVRSGAVEARDRDVHFLEPSPSRRTRSAVEA